MFLSYLSADIELSCAFKQGSIVDSIETRLSTIYKVFCCSGILGILGGFRYHNNRSEAVDEYFY